MNRGGAGSPSSSALRILPTKLFVPRRRQATIPRPDLVRRIEEGTSRPLTLVVAPAGFGKTTLVTQWIDETKLPVAWLSLEQADAEPLRFLSYLLAAIGRVRPQVGQLGGVAPASAEVSLDALLGELLVVPLAEEAAPFALVLDDFHEIADHPAIVGAVDRLVDNLPHCMHLVVTSRVEPALSLAVRRARDAVTEVQGADLAFSRSDARRFFHDAMGLGLDDQAMGTLHQRTEGWVAGMQLAGLSLRQGASPDDVLRGLTADGDLAEFLGKEILDVVDEDLRRFLLDTSVLGRLCAPLCEAVTEQAPAGATLRAAVREGLFLVPLDHRRTWYRYHQLFRDILLRRLRAETPEREPLLHRRAARWWMGQDDPHSAASHATLAGAHDLLGEIIERWGLSLLHHSDRHSIERWLAALPDDAFARHPVASTLAGWLAVLPVRAPPRTDAALAAVKRAREALAAAGATAEGRAELLGHLVAIEAIATRPVADLAGCIAHAGAALASLGSEADAARTVLALQIGVLHIMLGRPRDALASLERAEEWGASSGNVFAGIAAMAYRAWARRWLGDLGGAEETCRAALLLAERVGVAGLGLTGHVHVEQARIHHDRGELASALSSLEEALPRARLLSDPFLLTTALTIQARVLNAAGEPELADASSREAGELAERTGHPLLLSWARSCRWHLALARGTDAGIDPTIPGPGTYQPITHEAALCAVLHAIGRGEGSAALDACRQLVDHSHRAGCVSQAIDWSIACACALAAVGRAAEAAPFLADAIDRARAQRLVRPFIEAGERIAVVAGALAEADRRFLEPLLATTPPRSSAAAPAPVQSRRADLEPLAEPLSRRELEVLGLVRRGKSNADIARALFVSTGTIKTHMHRLMTKMGARNRVEAIRLAEDRGLLSDP